MLTRSRTKKGVSIRLNMTVSLTLLSLLSRGASWSCYFQSQSVARFNRLARPKLLCFRFQINSVPFGIEMREHHAPWLGEFCDAHCILQFQMRRHRLF